MQDSIKYLNFSLNVINSNISASRTNPVRLDKLIQAKENILNSIIILQKL